MAKIKKYPKLLHGTINPSLRDHANDPCVVRKANEARELLKKHPIPKEILERLFGEKVDIKKYRV